MLPVYAINLLTPRYVAMVSYFLSPDVIIIIITVFFLTFLNNLLLNFIFSLGQIYKTWSWCCLSKQDFSCLAALIYLYNG